MGWAVGYDTNWQRWVGYGVPSICDYPSCGERINRGLAYVCGNDVFGGERGCGLYFCEAHLSMALPYDDSIAPDAADGILCARCAVGEPAFEPTPDTTDWLRWMRDDGSWGQWRDEHPASLRELRAELTRRWVAELSAKSAREWADA